MNEPRNAEIGKADGVILPEGNIPLGVIGESRRGFPGVEEPGMYTNNHSATWETLTLFPY
ncbi:hypothetical protein J2TS4_41860 [Paenibacillus sp. J2TS4]|nr:hypothetical protein J2TS4_41860 [Paenibacillus sp. J2TS4]